jgi:hypothetical protein
MLQELTSNEIFYKSLGFGVLRNFLSDTNYKRTAIGQVVSFAHLEDDANPAINACEYAGWVVTDPETDVVTLTEVGFTWVLSKSW